MGDSSPSPSESRTFTPLPLYTADFVKEKGPVREKDFKVRCAENLPMYKILKGRCNDTCRLWEVRHHASMINQIRWASQLRKEGGACLFQGALLGRIPNGKAKCDLVHPM